MSSVASNMIRLYSDTILIANDEDLIKREMARSGQDIDALKRLIENIQERIRELEQQQKQSEQRLLTLSLPKPNKLAQVRQKFKPNWESLWTQLRDYTNAVYPINNNTIVLRIIIEFLKSQYDQDEDTPYLALIWKIACIDKHHLMITVRRFFTYFTYNIAANLVSRRRIWDIIYIVERIEPRAKLLDKEIADKIQHKNHNPRKVRELQDKLEKLTSEYKYDRKNVPKWEQYLRTGEFDRISRDKTILDNFGTSSYTIW